MEEVRGKRKGRKKRGKRKNKTRRKGEAKKWVKGEENHASGNGKEK